MNCVVCGAAMGSAERSYMFECRCCGFLASNLEPAVGAGTQQAIDESARRHALKALRSANFELTLDRLEAIRPLRGALLLEVGSAHGWFLQAAERRGAKATGIEPDRATADEACRSGLQVIVGSFPDAMPAGQAFDLIAFNDVFEHLPDLRAATAACFEGLRAGGLLAITLPSSKGTFFRLARMLAALRLTGPLDRMWQRGFPSPHLSYFHPDGLARFLSGRGFEEIRRESLPSLSRDRLWQRIRYDRQAAAITSVVYFALLYLLGGMLAKLPSDISLQIFRRKGDARAAAG